KHENIWNVVECICRILGVSTATVLCGVGVETLQQGEFSSLGVYLLVSSVCIMIFELAYFLDALLSVCLPCPPDWRLFLLWGKMAHVGGFHKFLAYSIMSVVCFLHPVLVWHAVIPDAGTMLLLTGLFNFLLSKKTKVRPSKEPQEGQSSNQGLTPMCATDGGALSQSSFSFLHSGTGRRAGGLALAIRDSGESVQAMLEQEQTAAPPDEDRERRRWRERRLIFSRRQEQPVEKEMEEMECYSQPDTDTTSDTAPMIT
uniref:Transmembrane protein 72 n=1 Tax=Tetraodon nigroviridis TaxID=99883 RepID=H3C1W9_TETNG